MGMTDRFDPAVTALLDDHQHPLRDAMDLLRGIVLDADPHIEEGVKWNTASFRTTEWFATLNGPKQVKEPMIVLHAGAKAKGRKLNEMIEDPTGMVTWLGADRGMITFSLVADIEERRVDLQDLIRTWIAHI